VQFGKEASQTREYSVAKNATRCAARPDPSLRQERFLRMTINCATARAQLSKALNSGKIYILQIKF